MKTNKIILLCVLLCLVVFTHSCSMLTHIEIATRAFSYFSFEGYENFKAIIERHPSSFQAGATFPDWGYPRNGYHSASELAHWPPFYILSAEYIVKNYPQPWTEDAERLIAFLLGGTSHMVADISWHSLTNIPDGFIQAMSHFGFNSTYGIAHTVADLGGDTVLAVQNDLSYVLYNWSVPIKDISNIYALDGWPNVTELVFTESMLEVYAGTIALRDGGAEVLYPNHAEKSAFLVDQFQDYFIGGLDDMAVTTALCWPYVMQWFINGPGPEICPILQSVMPHTSVYNFPEELYEERKFVVENTVVQKSPSGEATITFNSKVHNEAIQMKQPISLSSETKRSVIYSTNNYSYLGYDVTAVNLNGDSYTDLIITAPGYSSGGEAQRGCAYILFGSQNLSLPNFSDIDSMDSIKICGNSTHDRFGHSVTVLDFNLDGVLDFVASSPTTNYSVLGYQGQVYLFFGSMVGSTWKTSSIPSVTISGTFYSNFGFTLITGDINADKHPDLIVGCPFAREYVNNNNYYNEAGYVAGFAASATNNVGSSLTVSDAYLFLNAPIESEVGVKDHGWWGNSLLYVPADENIPFPYLLVGGAGNLYFNQSYSCEECGTISVYALDGSNYNRPKLVFYGNHFERIGADMTIGQISSLTSDNIIAISMPLINTTVPQAGQVVLLSFNKMLNFVQNNSILTNWIVPFDELQPYIITKIYGDQVFSRFGGPLHFINVTSLSKTKESLFVGYPMWTGITGLINEGCICMWENDSLPKGIVKYPTLGASRVFTSLKATEGLVMEKGSRFGGSISFGDFNGDGDTDMVVGSHRRSIHSYLGGSIEILFSIAL